VLFPSLSMSRYLLNFNMKKQVSRAALSSDSKKMKERDVEQLKGKKVEGGRMWKGKKRGKRAFQLGITYQKVLEEKL